MPTVTRCPSCERALQVPDDLLGQMVQCPSCGTTFTASAASTGPAAPPASRQPPPREQAPPPFVPLEQDEERGERRRRYDDEGWDDEDDYGRRPRRGRDTSSAVAAPAICLMVVGGLSIVAAIFQGALLLSGVGQQNRGFGGNREEQIGFMVGAIGAIPIGLISGILILTGAIRMKNLQNYGLAMTASILAMVVPCNLCCVLGLPFGIWALVVLNKPEIKDAFRA